MMAIAGAHESEVLPQDISQVKPGEAAALFRRIHFRLGPLLFLSYTLAFIDRVNVGFTQLKMKGALGITAQQFGLAAGLFYVTYIIFELPSNLMVERIGMRKQLLRIMVLWGLTSAATAFVRTPGQYYAERLLLGAFEAGFFPAIVLYMSNWLPSQERGKAMGFFLMGAVIAGLIGNPVSGLIMSNMDGVWGFSGWQWCFIVEGLPCVILGVINFVCLYDKPEQAKWLNPREKKILILSLEAERQADKAAYADKWWKVLRDPRIYLLAFLIISCQGGAMVLNFWLPTIIKNLGVKSLANVGYLGIIPFAAAAVGLLFITRSSDRHAERRWHFAMCAIVTALALVVAPQFSKSLFWSLVVMTIMSIGINASIPTFWAIPARYLGPAAAAGGLALISSLAALGNFFSPIVMGYLIGRTGSMASGMYVHAAALFLAGLAMLILVPKRAVTVGVQQPAAKKAGA